MKYRDFVRILKENGFEMVRQKGSHRQFQAFIGGERRLVTVSSHQDSDDILPKNFASMIRQSGLPKSFFI